MQVVSYHVIQELRVAHTGGLHHRYCVNRGIGHGIHDADLVAKRPEPARLRILHITSYRFWLLKGNQGSLKHSLERNPPGRPQLLQAVRQCHGHLDMEDTHLAARTPPPVAFRLRQRSQACRCERRPATPPGRLMKGWLTHAVVRRPNRKWQP